MVEIICWAQTLLWGQQVGVGVHSSRDHQMTVRVHCPHIWRDDQVLTNLPEQETGSDVRDTDAKGFTDF